MKDVNGMPKYLIQGYWDKYIDILKVNSYDRHSGSSSKSVLETGPPTRIWVVNPP